MVLCLGCHSFSTSTASTCDEREDIAIDSGERLLLSSKRIHLQSMRVSLQTTVLIRLDISCLILPNWLSTCMPRLGRISRAFAFSSVQAVALHKMATCYSVDSNRSSQYQINCADSINASNEKEIHNQSPAGARKADSQPQPGGPLPKKTGLGAAY